MRCSPPLGRVHFFVLSNFEENKILVMDHLTESREWMWWGACWCHVGKTCSPRHVEEALHRYGRLPQFEFWLARHLHLLRPDVLPVECPWRVLERLARDPKQRKRVLRWHRPEYIVPDASAPFYAALLMDHGLLPRDSPWIDASSQLIAAMESKSTSVWDTFLESHDQLDVYVLRHHSNSGPFLAHLSEQFVDEVWSQESGAALSSIEKVFLNTLSVAASHADTAVVSRLFAAFECPIDAVVGAEMAYRWVCLLASSKWRETMHTSALDVDQFYDHLAKGQNMTHAFIYRLKEARKIDAMICHHLPPILSGDGYDRAWREGRI